MTTFRGPSDESAIEKLTGIPALSPGMARGVNGPGSGHVVSERLRLPARVEQPLKRDCIAFDGREGEHRDVGGRGRKDDPPLDRIDSQIEADQPRSDLAIGVER